MGRELIRARIVVEGEVQRVGFRDLVQRVARGLGVRGFVENLRDGTVQVVCEAEERVLGEFVKGIDVREDFIVVEGVRVVETSEATGEFEYFDIRHGPLEEELGDRMVMAVNYAKATGREIGEMRSDMKRGFGELRSDIKGVQTEIGEMRSDMKSGFGELRSDIKGVQTEIGEMRSEMSRGFEGLSTDIKGVRSEIGGVHSEIGEMRTDMNRSFEEMAKRYDAISAELVRTREELTKAVEGLLRLIEEFIRERREG